MPKPGSSWWRAGRTKAEVGRKRASTIRKAIKAGGKINLKRASVFTRQTAAAHAPDKKYRRAGLRSWLGTKGK